jgi:hypothetical protein
VGGGADAAGEVAWALIANHAHLVLRTGNRPLSEVMRRLNTGYARGFNLRHRRSGYLFQNRFRSIVVDDDAYLPALGPPGAGRRASKAAARVWSNPPVMPTSPRDLTLPTLSDVRKAAYPSIESGVNPEPSLFARSVHIERRAALSVESRRRHSVHR